MKHHILYPIEPDCSGFFFYFTFKKLGYWRAFKNVENSKNVLQNYTLWLKFS